MLDLLQLTPPGWGGALLRGALLTLQIALLSYAIGLALGLLGAAAKLSGSPVLAGAGEVYTTLVRAVPELLLIILLFYGGSTMLEMALIALGFPGAVQVSGFAAAIAVLGVVQGAYQTEVIRGAIEAIPVGQIEAARAFGMSPSLRLRRIVIPALLPIALPGFANLWLILLKDTALISIVGISELLYVGKQAAGATRHYFFFYCVVGAIYLAMTLVSNGAFRLIERRVRRGIPAA
ncbi:ABC transporter permease [Lutibaculum baratangense]|uniref:Histidine ABC transporter, permease protein HisQ n=1 Tax=Lutibaculum baratangense AMV1 TaxID=631454 RepID=V4RRH5_9HYPH|nr:ABC transporter permease subunit [Lutibaculum baratangense]ESR25745.1 Histidine ABC transporter, permease protein HisQ [Lutibaculum baratangense AMV1]